MHFTIVLGLIVCIRFEIIDDRLCGTFVHARHLQDLVKTRSTNISHRVKVGKRAFARTAPMWGILSNTESSTFLSRNPRWYVTAKRCASSRIRVSSPRAWLLLSRTTGSLRRSRKPLPLFWQGLKEARCLRAPAKKCIISCRQLALPPSTITREGSSSKPCSPLKSAPETPRDDFVHRSKVVRALHRLILKRRYDFFSGLPPRKTAIDATESVPCVLDTS